MERDALDPEDVRNKQFTTVRLREGYDEDEVDAFLDEVEAELTRLLRENDELRAKLAAATRVAAAGGRARSIARKTSFRPCRLRRQRPVVDLDVAARVLAMAQQTADQAIAEARNEANKIVTEARARPRRSSATSRPRRGAGAGCRRHRHRAAMGSLDQQRQILERKVEDLRQFEREYRSRLRSYLEGQLRQLESQSYDADRPRTPASR